MSRRPGFLAAALGAALLAPASANADFAGDLSVLVAAIDASPDWIATAHDVVPGSDGGTVGGLSIRAEDGVLWIELEGLSVKGYAPRETGGFSTTSIEVRRVRIELGAVSVTYGQSRLDGLAVGPFPAVDANRPATAAAKIYGALAKASLGSGQVEEVTVRSVEGAGRSDVVYRDLTFGPLRNGIVEQSSIAAIKMAAGDAGSQIAFESGRTEARDLNLDTFAHVFDPDRYINGTGDGQWRDAVGLMRYRDLSFSSPDGKVEIGGIFQEHLRLRQPQASFTPILDEFMVRPDVDDEAAGALLARHGIDLLAAVSVGRLGFDELEVAGPAVDRFRLGGFRLIDASIAGIGELAVSDVEAAVPDAGEFTMRRFTVGDIVFPEIGLLRQAIAAPGTDPAGGAAMPLPGFIEAVGVRAFSPGRIDVALDRARLEMSGFIGTIPTSLTARIDGLSVDSSIIQDRRIRTVLSRLGYDRLAADYGYRLFWRESDRRLIVKDLNMTVGNAGSVNIDVELSGLTREDFAEPDRLPEALENLKLENAAVRVTDDSLLNRVFQMQATELGIEPSLLKEQMTGALPFFLLPLGNPEFAGKLAPALRDFVMKPGTLLVTANPRTPLPISDLIATGETAPQTLPDLLGVDVRNR